MAFADRRGFHIDPPALDADGDRFRNFAAVPVGFSRVISMGAEMVDCVSHRVSRHRNWLFDLGTDQQMPRLFTETFCTQTRAQTRQGAPAFLLGICRAIEYSFAIVQLVQVLILRNSGSFEKISHEIF